MKTRQFTATSVLLAALAAAPLFAGLPSRSTFEGIEDLDRGELNNLSLTADGALSLAPRLTTLPIPAAGAGVKDGFDDVFIWSLLATPEGQIFAGTGNGGGVLTGKSDGALTVIGRTGDLIITALARDAHGDVYAAGLPSGKIYRVNADKLEPYAQVPAPYVWALAAHPDGRLLAATGPDGVLYAIGADKKAVPFYKSTEKNLTALAIAPDGGVLVGTEPSGLVVRLTPEGKPSVLFDASQNEIRALAVDKAGRVYAAATSAQRGTISSGAASAGGGGGAAAAKTPETNAPEKRAAGDAPASSGAASSASSSARSESSGDKPEPAAASSRSVSPTRFGRKGVDSNQAVYRISADGIATPVLSVAQAAMLSLAVDTADRVWVGTGNSGLIFRIDGNQVVKLVRTECSQVLALAPLADGGMAFGTGGPARVLVAGPGVAPGGTWTSEPRDFTGPARFGQLGFRHQATAAGSVRVSTRSGNSAKPDDTWSPWSAAVTRETGAPVASPSARYLQVKVELGTTDATTTPRVTSVWLIAQGANAAPDVDKFTLAGPSVDISSDPRDLEQREATKEKRKKREAPSLKHLKWEASDPNEDRLSYKLALRGEGESTWRDLSQRDLTSNTLDWDTQDLPDGFYRVRLTVSDAPSNPEGTQLTNEQVSEPILIDNTPPHVDMQVVAGTDGSAEVSGTIQDGPGAVLAVEYALDDGDYRAAGVTDGMADSPREMLRVKLANLAPGEHALSVRAYDELGNAGTARRTIVIPKR